LKYAYWCKSSSDISDAKLLDDYQHALKECLSGNPEFLEHVRFSSVKVSDIGTERLSFGALGLGPSLKHILKLYKEGTVYIEDDILKRKITSSSKKISSVIDCDVERKQKLHPTQKPIELMKKLVSLYSKERRHCA